MSVIKFTRINGMKCNGEVDYEIIDNPEYSVMKINLIMIGKKYRGKGYGRILMENLINKARSNGCKYIIVELPLEEYGVYLPYKERRRFFEHFGFRFDDSGEKGVLKVSYA